MKLYEMASAPNPRRVRMFLAEKGLQNHVQRVELDLQKGEHLTAAFSEKNPLKSVPVLELDDGTCFAESMAICRYMEKQYPNTLNLLGNTSRETALIEQWQRWLEFKFFMPIGMAFQHLTDYFAETKYQNQAWGNECKHQAQEFLAFLNNELEGEQWICAGRFTAADITAFCAIEFARVVEVRMQPGQNNLQAWYNRVAARDSAKA